MSHWKNLKCSCAKLEKNKLIKHRRRCFGILKGRLFKLMDRIINQLTMEAFITRKGRNSARDWKLWSLSGVFDDRFNRRIQAENVTVWEGQRDGWCRLKAARKRMTTVDWVTIALFKRANRKCLVSRVPAELARYKTFKSPFVSRRMGPESPRKFIIRLRFIIFVAGVLSVPRLAIYSFISFLLLLLLCFYFTFFCSLSICLYSVWSITI